MSSKSISHLSSIARNKFYIFNTTINNYKKTIADAMAPHPLRQPSATRNSGKASAMKSEQKKTPVKRKASKSTTIAPSPVPNPGTLLRPPTSPGIQSFTPTYLHLRLQPLIL